MNNSILQILRINRYVCRRRCKFKMHVTAFVQEILAALFEAGLVFVFYRTTLSPLKQTTMAMLILTYAKGAPVLKKITAVSSGGNKVY